MVNIKSTLNKAVMVTSLEAISRRHLNNKAQHHISRISDNLYQIVVVPHSKNGNLTESIVLARKLGDMLLVELGLRNGMQIWVEESGTSAYRSSLESTAITILFLCLIVLASILLHKAVNGKTPSIPGLMPQAIFSIQQFDTSSIRRTLQAPFQAGRFTPFDAQTKQQSMVRMSTERGGSASMVELDATALPTAADVIIGESFTNSFENPMFNPDAEGGVEKVDELFKKCTRKSVDEEERPGGETSTTVVGFENPIFGNEIFLHETEPPVVVEEEPEGEAKLVDLDTPIEELDNVVFKMEGAEEIIEKSESCKAEEDTTQTEENADKVEKEADTTEAATKSDNGTVDIVEIIPIESAESKQASDQLVQISGRKNYFVKMYLIKMNCLKHFIFHYVACFL